MMNPRFYTIIPAAGIGARMNADRPKQYLTINNEVILQKVINTFSAISCIEKVIVALHPEDHWWPSLQLAHPEKVMHVVGGKARVDSVLCGLSFLKDFAKAEDFVLVHDAARPGITEKNIMMLIAAVKDHPVGGLLGLPVVDTLKKVNDQDCVQATISREHLWAAQTPQCFRFALLKNAIEQALFKGEGVTDESQAIELQGYQPLMMMGDPRNKKVTYPEDL